MLSTGTLHGRLSGKELFSAGSDHAAGERVRRRSRSAVGAVAVDDRVVAVLRPQELVVEILLRVVLHCQTDLLPTPQLPKHRFRDLQIRVPHVDAADLNGRS